MLGRVLSALAAQTLPREDFEILVIDNGSQPPLTPAELPGTNRLLREPRAGQAHARALGIREARAPLLVFVDDDNVLYPDYLERAAAIAAADPRLGAFGGIAEAALPKPVPAWTRPLWPALGIRDHGPEVITRASDGWGPWLPIGAGCVVRREAALRYADLISREGLGDLLGRSGRRMITGDDTLLAWTAAWEGYACSYQPSLRLRHCVCPARFRWRHLIRNEFGHGVSFPRLEALRGKPVVTGPLPRQALNLAVSLVRRIRELGFCAGVIRWCWDWGVHCEAPRLRLPPGGLSQPVRSAH